MTNVWENVQRMGEWAAWLPVAWYGFIKNHPGSTAILWPATFALAVWWL